MPDQLQPGDIWLHQGMGRLYVTDEDIDLRPGYLKCYWAMGGNTNAPYTFLKRTKTKGLTLVQRLGEQAPDGTWHIKRG